MSTSFQPPNYRDVGEALGLWLEPSPLPTGRLLRGGKLDAFSALADVGNPGTILNLRRGPDPHHLTGVTLVQVAADNEQENYDTTARGVRQWLRRVLDVLADPATRWPVYVHCTSGRDRTGIVVATALLLVGVPREVVVEEYMLSEGADLALIQRAIDGLGDPARTLGLDPRKLRAALLPVVGQGPDGVGSSGDVGPGRGES